MGISRGDRQECECTNELTTPLMTAKSEIKDKIESQDKCLHSFAEEN